MNVVPCAAVEVGAAVAGGAVVVVAAALFDDDVTAPRFAA